MNAGEQIGKEFSVLFLLSLSSSFFFIIIVCLLPNKYERTTIHEQMYLDFSWKQPSWHQHHHHHNCCFSLIVIVTHFSYYYVLQICFTLSFVYMFGGLQSDMDLVFGSLPKPTIIHTLNSIQHSHNAKWNDNKTRCGHYRAGMSILLLNLNHGRVVLKLLNIPPICNNKLSA